MNKINIKICLIIISILFLSGCGFTLRSAKSLPPQLQQIYYQADNPYGQFELTLKKMLKFSNIKLLKEPSETAPTLHISSSYNYNTPSSISSSEPRNYTLDYAASISINDGSGKLLLPVQSASISRNLVLQPNEVFEITPQVEIVKQEMCQELATKILNILCAPKTFQSLKQ